MLQEAQELHFFVCRRVMSIGAQAMQARRLSKPYVKFIGSASMLGLALEGWLLILAHMRSCSRLSR